MQQLLGACWRSIQVRLSDFKTNANDSTLRLRPQRKLQLKVNEHSEAKHPTPDFVRSIENMRGGNNENKQPFYARNRTVRLV